MRSSIVLTLALAAGCAAHAEGGTDVESAASAKVEMDVGDLREGDDARLREELSKISGVSEVRVQGGRGHATVTLTYEGCVCDLKDALARIEYPALRVTEEHLTLVVNAADEKPPEIVFVFPEPTEDEEPTVVTEADQNVVVEVTDDSGELASVKVGGQDAQNIRGHVYQAPVT